LIQRWSLAGILSCFRSAADAFVGRFGAIAPAASHFSASCCAFQSSVVITV
jgi:hypothetical protein